MPQPAKSAKLQLLNGNPNKKNTEELRKRAAAEEKLKMATDKIKPPTWLDQLGKQTFEFIAEELLTVELVSNPDLYSMALYSDWYSQYVALEKQLRKLQREYKLNYEIDKEKAKEEGKPFNNPNELIGNPLSRQMDTASRNLRSFGSDLGLSPSARAKLAIKMADDGGDDDDDF
ncbi:phage terminase small subunit P27 family [Enterococcus avium]|uniref:Phage terminase small subunit P27 family n=1 Tax=Enterococcus avium TaxID=33945 RepID=A0AAW8RUE6_ENTAV|nr:phage terminase small subunit P27 family [Enterococcus avium]MDT2403634.1 phage terminase small subunit P27 family [Enterococcus avium]